MFSSNQSKEEAKLKHSKCGVLAMVPSENPHGWEGSILWNDYVQKIQEWDFSQT